MVWLGVVFVKKEIVGYYEKQWYVDMRGRIQNIGDILGDGVNIMSIGYILGSGVNYYYY